MFKKLSVDGNQSKTDTDLTVLKEQKPTGIRMLELGTPEESPVGKTNNKSLIDGANTDKAKSLKLNNLIRFESTNRTLREPDRDRVIRH